MVDLQTTLQISQMILALANICVIGYGFYKFINKPHDTLETRVSILEANLKELKTTNDTEHKDIRASLITGTGRFKEQDDTNEVLIRSTLALIEFEVQYCLMEHKEMSEDLKQAKKDLRLYLSQK